MRGMIEKVCVCAHECTKKQAIKTQRSTEEAQRREGKTATGHCLSGLSTAEGWALSLYRV